MTANAKKPIDLAKQGMNSVKNAVVKKNLMGVSESMTKKGWKDSQGRSGKVLASSSTKIWTTMHLRGAGAMFLVHVSGGVAATAPSWQ